MNVEPHRIANELVKLIVFEVERQQGDEFDVFDVLSITVAMSIAKLVVDPQKWRLAIELMTQNIQDIAEKNKCSS